MSVVPRYLYLLSIPKYKLINCVIKSISIQHDGDDEQCAEKLRGRPARRPTLPVPSEEDEIGEPPQKENHPASTSYLILRIYPVPSTYLILLRRRTNLPVHASSEYHHNPLKHLLPVLLILLTVPPCQYLLSHSPQSTTLSVPPFSSYSSEYHHQPSPSSLASLFSKVSKVSASTDLALGW